MSGARKDEALRDLVLAVGGLKALVRAMGAAQDSLGDAAMYFEQAGAAQDELEACLATMQRIRDELSALQRKHTA